MTDLEIALLCVVFLAAVAYIAIFPWSSRRDRE